MKRILITLCMALCLASTAWAGNPGGKIRSLVTSFKGTKGFDVVDLGGPAMLLLKAAARAEVDDPEDRAAMDLFRSLRRLTVVDFSEAAPEKREKFLRKLDRILAGEEVLMEAKDGGEKVAIYGLTSKDGSRIDDIIIRADDALISVRGSIRTDQVEALMKQASK
ncbi:MAG: DUF4252 domain-containing protein [Bacteroidales bacterium]|nr:DUF4252 domain-containing protein [Bacteroidales bacterium]